MTEATTAADLRRRVYDAARTPAIRLTESTLALAQSGGVFHLNSTEADEIAAAVAGKRVLVYNLSYDDGRLHHELGLAGADGAAWRGQGRTRWEDVMVPYSDWYGDWSEYWGNYSWQPLNGGHRALGDCLAVIDCLKAMARSRGAEDDEEQAA